MKSRPSRITRLLYRAPVVLYHWRCGWLLGRRFILLVHVGRRSGRRRETVLEVVDYRQPGPELVVLSAYGPGADWLRNIERGPDPEVITGRQRFVAAHRFLDAAEAIAALRRYEQRNRLAAPIIRRVLTRLLGWPYRGSDSDRRRLAAQLPMIAFRPRS